MKYKKNEHIKNINWVVTHKTNNFGNSLYGILKEKIKRKEKKKIVQQVLFCIKYFIKQLHDWRREKKKKEKKR